MKTEIHTIDPGFLKKNIKHFFSTLSFTLLMLFLCLLYFTGILNDDTMKVFAAISVLLTVSLIYFLNRVLILTCVFTLLPFSRGFLQFEIGVVTFSPFTIGTIGLLALNLLGLYKFIKYRGFHRIDLLVILLGLYYFISTMNAEDKLIVGHVAFHALFIPICAYFLLLLAIRSLEESNNVIVGLLLGTFIFGIIHIAVSMATGKRTIVLGVPGVSVATMMVFPIIFLFLAGYYGRLKSRIFAVPALFSLIISLSRVYILSILFSPIIYRISRAGKGLIVFLFFLIASLVATIILTLAADQQSGTYLGYKLPQSSNQREEIKAAEKSADRLTSGSHLVSALYGRALAQKYALRQFMASPLLGTGIRPKETGLATQHNFHIEWLQYGGIVGYLIYAGIFVGFFRRTNSQAKEDKVTAALQVSILILLTNSLTNGIMHGYMPTVIFTLMGIARSRSQLSAT